MTEHTPAHCRPHAYQFFATWLKHIQSPDGLLNASLAPAMHAMEQVNPIAVIATLQGYADQINRMVRSDRPEARLAHLHHLMFDQCDFAGSHRDTAHLPTNHLLPHVLKTRRGSSLTLALIYCDLARRIHLTAKGLNTPQRVIVRIEMPQNITLIDPFDRGKVVDRHDLHQLFENHLGSSLTQTPAVTPLTGEQWIGQMLENLRNDYKLNNQQQQVAAINEMIQLVKDRH